jgi:hypothetical protein
MAAARWWAFEGESAVIVGERVGDALMKELDGGDGRGLTRVLDDEGRAVLRQAMIDVVWKTLNPQEM